MTNLSSARFLSRLKIRCRSTLDRLVYAGLMHLASYCARLGRPDRAFQLESAAIRYAHDPDSVLTCGQAYAAKNDGDHAVYVYQRAIERFPQDLRFYEGLATIAQGRKRWSEVIRYLTLICERGAPSAAVYRRIGQANLKQKQWPQAEQAYRSALMYEPDHDGAQHGLGLALNRQERWSEASEALTRAIQLQPEAMRTRAQLCVALAHQGKWRESCETLMIAIVKQRAIFSPVGPWLKQLESLDLDQSWPDTVEAFEIAIETFIDAGRYFELDLAPVADCAFLQAIARFPNHIWHHFFYFNRLLIRFRNQDRLDHLCDQFRTAIAATPDARESYLNLAAIADFRGDSQTSAIAHATLLDREAGLDTNLGDRESQALLPETTTRLPPSFLIIGTQKGGTTSLHRYLCEHPQIQPAAHKEIDFWSTAYDRGLAWYMAQFPPRSSDDRSITGEASPTYFDHPETPARLRATFPNVKLILVLRDPTDRAISHYYHRYRERNLITPIETFLRSELDFTQQYPPEFIPADRYATHLRGRLLSRGLYSTFVKRWLQYFSRDQILAIESRELFSQTGLVLERVHRFLDLEPQPLDRYPVFNPGTYRHISPALEAELRHFFRPYNEELMTLLDLDFDWP
ncbi:MAG: tetratricopeptide repeat protein [Coleofasciculaceae cyanobacterium RL_1_1]|nr:tetratricopeptide repeat protein [Coleofasciculaceae cyanobacterium RL_1_1]